MLGLALTFGLGFLGSFVSDLFNESSRDENLKRANEQFNEVTKANDIKRDVTREEINGMIERQGSRNIIQEINEAAESYTPSEAQKYLQRSAETATANKNKDLGLYDSAAGRQDVANTAALAASQGLYPYIDRVSSERQQQFANQANLLGMRANVEGQGANENIAVAGAEYGAQTRAGETTYKDNKDNNIFDAVASKSLNSGFDMLRQQNDLNFAKEHTDANKELLKK